MLYSERAGTAPELQRAGVGGGRRAPFQCRRKRRLQNGMYFNPAVLPERMCAELSIPIGREQPGTTSVASTPRIDRHAISARRVGDRWRRRAGSAARTSTT
jgi:hypothetical protein